jgi:hypothetical protein
MPARAHRQFIGHVAGGNLSDSIPPNLQVGDFPAHALGRLDTMAEILVNALFLKSKGFARSATGYKGADFQDFSGNYTGGVHRYDAAHRALFSLLLDGQNANSLTSVAGHERLREMLAAPQARTDQIPKQANYADTLLERSVNQSIFYYFKGVIDRQPMGSPADIEQIVGYVKNTKRLIVAGYGRAMNKFLEGQLARGTHFSTIGSPTRLSLEDQDINDLIDGMDRNMSLFESDRSKDFPDFVETALSTSRELTARSYAALSDKGKIKEYLEELEGCLNSW